MQAKWLDIPEDHDYQAAADYLSMVAEPDVVDKTVNALRTAKPVHRKAKDILRAARLDLLAGHDELRPSNIIDCIHG
jgi:hypothetical protein